MNTPQTFSNKRGDIVATLDGKKLTVNYKGESRVFDAWANGERAWASRVFGGKFKTGTKIWPLSVTVWFKSGNVVIDNGGYSNKGGVTSVTGWFNADNPNATKSHGAR